MLKSHKAAVFCLSYSQFTVTARCEPQQVKSQNQSHDPNRTTTRKPKFSADSDFARTCQRFGVVSQTLSPDKELQEAGGAVQQGRLAGSQLTSNRRKGILAHFSLVQCMNALQ